MSNNLRVNLTISAGVAGLNQMEQLIRALAATGQNTEQLEEELRGLRQNWERLDTSEQTRHMEQLAQRLNQAQSSQSALNREASEGGGIFESLKGKILGVGAALTGFFALSKIKDFFSGGVQEAASFERQMQTVAAVSGATAEELASLSDKAKAMGASTQYSATEAAQGLENLMRAGLSSNDAMNALAPTLALAQGNGLELAEAATFITQATAGMGLSMQESARVADVLAKGASSANTNVQDLALGLSYAAPSANALGLSLEETVAYLGKFADAGIDGSRAGTALNNMLAQFNNGGSSFRKELSALGIRTTNFTEALRLLAAAGAKGNNAINALGAEGAPAFRALAAAGFDALDGLQTKLENAGGTAQKQAAVMDDSLDGAFSGLQSAWASVKLTLAEPILKPLAEKVRELSQLFSDLVASGKIKELGENIARWFSQSADVVMNFVKHLDFSKHIDAISQKFDQWTNGTSSLTGGLWALDKALSVVNIAVQGLAAGLSTVMGLLQEAGNGLQGLAAIVGNSFGRITDWLGITENAAHQFDETLQKSFDRVGDGLQNVAQSVKANQNSILDSARNILGIQQEQAEATDQTTKSLKAQQSALAELKQAYITQPELVKAVKLAEESLANMREQSAQSALKNAQAQAEALERSKSALQAAGLDFDELLTGVSSKTKQTFENYTAAVYDAMQAGADATQIARAGFEKLAASIDSPQAWQALKAQIQSLEGGLESLTSGQLKRLEDGIKGIPNAAKTAMEQFNQALQSVDNVSHLQSLRTQIQSAFQAGEISAAQYQSALNQIQAKYQVLQETAQKTATAQIQAHQASSQSALENAKAVEKVAESVKKAGEQSETTFIRLYQKQGLMKEQIAELETHARRWEVAFIKAFIGSQPAQVANNLAKHISQLSKQMRAANEEIEALEGKIQDGTLSMSDLEAITKKTQSAFSLLDKATLSRLNQSIDKAREKLGTLRDEAKDTADELEAKLASLQGDDSKTRTREQQKELQALEEKRQSALGRGNRDEVAEYERALDLQRQIHEEENKQEQKRKQQEAERVARQATPAANAMPNNTAEIDKIRDAFDERIRHARKEGAEQLANDIYLAAKRRAY